MEKTTSGITICVTKEEQKILRDFYGIVYDDINISAEDIIDILDSIAAESTITNNENIKIEFVEE